TIGEVRELAQVIHLSEVPSREVYRADIERLLRHAVREHAQVCVPVLNTREVTCFEGRLEEFSKKLAVLLAHAEHCHRTDVTKDCIAYLLIYLREKLVRHRKREFVFAGL